MKAKREFKNTEIGKIPKDWGVIVLKEICEMERGFSYRSDHITDEETEIEFITINNIEKEGGLKKTVGLYLRDNVEVDEKFYVNKNNLFIANTDMAKGHIIGAPILIKDIEKRCVFSMDLTRLLLRSNDLITNFFFYLLSHPKIRNFMKRNAQGTNVLHLNHQLVASLKLPLPPLPEQKKIAEILSTVDEAIEKVDESIAKTERLKKGLMQELLTKGIGYKEFKDTEIGRIPKEWKIVMLKEVVDINKESRDPNREFPEREFLYIDIDSIENGTGVIKAAKTIIGREAPSRARRVIHYNDVIMSTVRPYLKAFAIVPREYDGQICSTGFAVLTCKERILPSYLLYTLFSNYVISQCNRMMVGGQYPALNNSQVEKIKLPLPSISEQRKITEMLSTVDKRLGLLRNKKERLERIKKGLMNDLLTGKKRVKARCNI
jgi:type I restriction enzyme S subunit